VDPADREAQWTVLMHAALEGDEASYRRLLELLGASLRRTVRSRFARYGAGDIDVEDVVQETLLAIHLKRHTWSRGEKLGPWVTAIVRNKLVDVMRRRGRRAEGPLDDVIDVLADEALAPAESDAQRDVQQMLGTLQERQQRIVRSISLEGRSVRETAEALAMSEVAVRVALHRSLKQLATIYRKATT
jgi:RNA polymerase sigma-70 factor (ECF subfamily)